MSPSKANFLLTEGVELISYTTVVGVLYGCAFMLYIFCAQSLHLQLKDRERRTQHLFTLLHMSLVVALTLIGLAIDARDMQTSYINNADYPDGGGFAYSAIVFGVSPIAVVGFVIGILVNLVISGIQIWRLWIIWGGSRYSFFIVALPVLSLLMDTGFTVADIAQSELSTRTVPLTVMFFYAEIASKLCVSVTVTVPIIVRILLVRRRNIKLMGQTDITNPYMSIVSILIESFALEFVWMVALLVNIAPSNSVTVPFGIFLSETQPYIQLLAYLLVVYRVTTGREWKEDTAEKLTTLQWNRDGLQTTQISTQTSIPITCEEA